MIVSFKEYDNRAEKLKKYKEKILKLIDEFVEFENINVQGEYKGSFDFYTNSKGFFVIQYYCSATKLAGFGFHHMELKLSHKQYEKLKEFMKNPELYKAAKKYNL